MNAYKREDLERYFVEGKGITKVEFDGVLYEDLGYGGIWVDPDGKQVINNIATLLHNKQRNLEWWLAQYRKGRSAEDILAECRSGY